MSRVKYIGIRGHRGSGKNTIAYLLGSIIQYFIDNKNSTPETLIDDSSFNIMYKVCCDAIKQDEQQALANVNNENVYIETFGSSPKMLIELLTDIPHEYFNSDYHKDHVVVNLKDFSWSIDENEANLKSLCSAQAVIEGVEREGFDNSTIYLSLREFIVYFATVCMKYLGSNIWVKAMRCNEKRNSRYDDYFNIGTIYKIFADIKAPSELSYVKELDGVIIMVERPEFAKTNKGVSTLDKDPRYDYKVTIEKDILEDTKLKEQLLNIAYALICK